MSVSDNHNQMISHDGESGTRASRILTAMVSNFTSARGRFILASLCMMFLTYLLLSQDPWWLFRAFPEEAARTLKHGVIDKVYHLVAYFGATCVLMWYAAAGSRRMFYGLAAVITCHAFVTEFLQQFVPRRTTDVDDLFANLVGVSAGVVAGILIRRATFTPNDSRNGDSLPDSARSGNALARTRSHGSADFVPGVIKRQLSSRSATRFGSVTDSSPLAVSVGRTRFNRLQLSSEQIAEVQPRQINYRVLGITVGVVALLLVSTYAVHGWQVRQVSGSLLQSAREAVVAGNSDEARRCFEQYCSSSPGDVNALAEFAIFSDDVRVRPNGGKGVFMLFERVLRKDPTRDDVRRRLVDTAIELARYSDALSHVKVLRQTYPKEGLFDYQAGICHESLSDHKAAAEAFQAAIDDTPELIDAWEHLAWLMHSEPGKAPQAEQLMLRLVQVNSQDVNAWIARARFRVRTQQFELADDDIDRVLTLAPSDFRVLHAAGEVGIARAFQAKSEGRLPLAERVAIETESLLARDDQPKSDQRKLDLQRIVLEAEFGRLKRAFDLAGCLLEDPSLPDTKLIHQLMAEIAIEHGAVEQAVASLDQLPRSEITDGQRLRVKSVVAMAEQRWADAVELLQAARKMLAESPQQLLKVDLKLANCLRHVGLVDDQLVVYRRMLKYAPQAIDARTGLASTLATAGRYPEALAEYRQLVHLPQIRLQMAQHLIDYNRHLPGVAQDWKEVSSLLDAADSDGDATVELVVLKADLLLAQGEFGKARQLVAQMMQRYPESGELLEIQVRIEELSGNEDAASRLKIRTTGDSGQLEEAERQLKLALLDSSQNADAAIAVMRFYLQYGQNDRAVEVFQKHAPQMAPIDLSQTYEAFGDLQRAVDILEQELRNHPENAAILQKLSELLIRNERSEQAEPLLRRLLFLQTDVSAELRRDARRSLAVILARKQNYRLFQEATSLMDENAAETPTIMTDDLRTMATVMRFSPKQSDHLVAIGLLEKIDDRRQMTPEDRWQLARLYIDVGLPKQADPQFDRAAKSGYASTEFLNDFITYLIRSEELGQASEQLGRLPVTFPASDLARLRTLYLVAVGQSSSAVTELNDFVEAADDADRRVERQLLAAGTCRTALAISTSAKDETLSEAVDRYLQAAVTTNPRQVSHLVVWLVERDRDVEAFDLLDTVWQELPPETAANLSLVMLRSGSNRNRRERVEQFLLAQSQKHPELLELKLCLADVRSLGEKYAEAEDLYREILRTDSQHVPALNSLAWVLAMRGRLLDEAMMFVERAISETGPVSRLLDTRGCVKLAQSRLRAASDDLIAAADAGSTPETFLHLAFAQSETGDAAMARRTLTHAVETGLRAERLHPFDRDLFNRLRSQIFGERSTESPSGVDL